MMNRYIRRVAIYIAMTMVLTILGAIMLFFAGRPVVSYVMSKGNLLIYQGAPERLIPDQSNSKKLLQEADAPVQSEDRDTVLAAGLGVIECDRITLSVPLYEDDSDDILSKGVGHYPKSGLPGEGKPILISGHDTTFFAPLEQIMIGDIVKVVMEDKDYYYSIVEAKAALATDTSAYDLSGDKEQLILYTCYPFGQLLGERKERYFVYGEPISAEEALTNE